MDASLSLATASRVRKSPIMFTFLLVIHAIIAAALVAVILMQRSEGGGLGMGGSPSGLMSARGAADFLTRATTILATLFVLMSIGLAVLASVQNGPRDIDTSLARQPGAAAGLAPALPAPTGGVPIADDPLAGVAATVANDSAPLAVPAVPATPAAIAP
ncbi:MAG: preprotein translocase subunit SecG, partial [Sphingomonas bacterium]|nr:preprotein translocase subunit SecG [Sphingomonas bacterium]